MTLLRRAGDDQATILAATCDMDEMTSVAHRLVGRRVVPGEIAIARGYEVANGSADEEILKWCRIREVETPRRPRGPKVEADIFRPGFPAP